MYNLWFASNYWRNMIQLQEKSKILSIDFNFKAFYNKMGKCGLESLHLKVIQL